MAKYLKKIFFKYLNVFPSSNDDGEEFESLKAPAPAKPAGA